jgi:hypothetical protein
MKLSKNVSIGDLVTLRGDKYVKCGKGMKPGGVYVKGISRTVIVYPSGEKERQQLSGGIQTWGECYVRMGY